MSDHDEKKSADDHEDDAAKGANNKPRGNPDIDQDALDKGIDQLKRVKPY